jgi:hypothetical protein
VFGDGEPVSGKLGQYFSFVGYSCRHDDVERGNAIRRYNEKVISNFIDVTDLTASMKRDVG